MGTGMPALPYKFQRTPGTTQDKWEHFPKYMEDIAGWPRDEQQGTLGNRKL